MKYRFLLSIILSLSLVFAIGCSDDDDDNPVGDNSGGDITITAPGAQKPIYTWDGGAVYYISVAKSSDPGNPVYMVEMASDILESGFEHGTIPGDAVASQLVEETLSVDETYIVRLRRSDSSEGTKEFTVSEGIWADSQDSDTYYVRFDASSHSTYRYYNIQNQEFVNVTDSDADNSTDWHLAFKRFYGKLNGGESGTLGMMGVDLADIDNPDSTDFDAVTEVPTITDEQWEEDTRNLMIGEDWFFYNGATHAFAPTENLYVMTTADNKFVKFVINEVVDAGMPPNMGTIGIRYVYQESGVSFTAEEQTVQIDGSSGLVYFSFAEGGAVTVDDPMNSDDWDIVFDSYEVRINGGISGNGMASVYPMYLEENTFENVTEAPTGGGYFADSVKSIFGAVDIAGSEWYDYDPVQHELISLEHVYILKLSDTEHYKMQIVNYYHAVLGEAQSGWVTIKIKEL